MLVSILEHELNAPNVTLSMSRLRVKVWAMYQHMNMTTNKNSKDEAYVNYQPFKGRCRECGKIGHKAPDCRSKNQNTNNYNRNNNNNYNNQNTKIIIENKQIIIGQIKITIEDHLMVYVIDVEKEAI